MGSTEYGLSVTDLGMFFSRLEVMLAITRKDKGDGCPYFSIIGKLRDELLNREIFDTLLEAKVLIEQWRREYNTVRPHSSLGYKPPAPETIEGSLPKTLTLEVVQ